MRGTPDETRARAADLVRAQRDVLWVSARDPGATPPPEVKRELGRSYDAVVLDLHDALDADVIGQSHGLVWGGGALVMRLPPAGEAPSEARARLVVEPFVAADVGLRFFARVERVFGRAPPSGAAPDAPLPPATRVERGTSEQAEVADVLARALRAREPQLAALLSDRGRGKSSALGLALRNHPGQVAVCAGQAESTSEIFRFAFGDPRVRREGRVRFVPPAELAHADTRYDAIVIDEAAQLPVPRLREITARHASTTIAFASTARGYEGTGRGFVLRFLAQLRADPRPLRELRLDAPIRWSAGDPLERAVFDALLLDAQPAPAPAQPAAALTHAVLDKDALARDEARLRELFGLLVHAHYRTTPSDLHRLLDAPNLRVHALLDGARVVAASLVALEGGLDPERCAALARGAARIRGHALPDTLVCHSGRVDAGSLRMIRSVRIAVHPDARRRGLGRALVDHVHATYAPDLFGTVFGATAELLAFRRQSGYALVRVGASRGTRTGEPAAVMLRPVTPAARALVADLRADLARDLPLQRALLAGELALDPALEAALAEGLPPPAPLDDARLEAIVRAYVGGPRPFEAAAYAVSAFVERHADALDGLDGAALIEARVRQRASWAEAARVAGFPSVPAAMRALRRAVRALAVRAGGYPPE